MHEGITLLPAMGRAEITLLCKSAEQIQLSQTNCSDEVRFNP